MRVSIFLALVPFAAAAAPPVTAAETGDTVRVAINSAERDMTGLPDPYWTKRAEFPSRQVRWCV